MLLEGLLRSGRGVGNVDAVRGRLSALADAGEAHVAQHRAQPRPGRPGVTQVAEPQQGDDERVLNGIERIGTVAEQADSGRVQRGPVALQQRGQRRHIPAQRLRAQLAVRHHNGSHATRMHPKLGKFANFFC